MARPKGAKDKVPRGQVQSFARQYLQDHNIQLKMGDQLILKPLKQQLYEIKLPRTKYQVGQLLVEEGEEKKIASYEELKETGWGLISVAVKDKRWERGQKIKYLLKRIEDVSQIMPSMPPDHFVKYNTASKQVRLVGPRAGPQGYGPWTGGFTNYHSREGIGGREITAKGKAEIDPLEELKKQYNELQDIEELTEPIEIPEAAIMITNANEIVCIPKLADMPSIMVVGLKRSGKSYLSHSIIDRLYWKTLFDYKIVILNDSSAETNTWAVPNNDKDQILKLEQLNERPLPLPIVYLHPMDEEEPIKYFMGDVGYDVTLPWKKVIHNHKKYLNMGDTSYYFTQLVPALIECKTEEEVRDILDNMKEDYKGIPPGTRNKILSRIDSLLDSKMTDISTEEQQPWTLSTMPEEIYNPVTACAHAGLITSLQTNAISEDTEKLSIYFSHFAGDLFNRQTQDQVFVDDQTQLFLVVDEAHNIASMSNKNTGAAKLLRRCVKEGGPRRVGTMIITQRFGDLPKDIKNNSTYIFCFKNPGEANEIANQYKLGKKRARDITNLDKHECLAYTSEKFIIYDSNGNRRESDLNEVFIGKSLPTLSAHKAPKTKDKVYSEEDEEVNEEN